MGVDGNAVAERWHSVLEPIVSRLSPPFSIEDLIAVAGREIACSITLDVLPPDLGPEVSGLTVAVDTSVRIYHPPGPEWMRLVVVAHQVAHLLLHRPPEPGPGIPTCTAVDQDGELLGIQLVDHLERLLADHGVLPADSGAAVQEQLDLLMPLRARLVDGSGQDGTVDLPPWPEPLRPAALPAPSEPHLRWRRQRVVTDIYDLRRYLGRLVPEALPALALEHVRGAGLSGQVAAAAADRICLEVALATRRAGAGGAGGRIGEGEPRMPGSTPSAAAAFVADQERLTGSGGVRQVIDTVRDRLMQPRLSLQHARRRG